MDNLLTDLRHRYATADALAKEVSLIVGNAVIPAQNELRNAGYHLLKSLRDGTEVVDVDHIKRAIDHCERAMYDAAEVGLISTIDSMDSFLNRFSKLSLAPVIPNIADIRRRIRERQELITRGRENESFDLEGFLGVFRENIEAYQQLQDSRPDLDAVLNKEKLLARRWAIALVTTLTLTVIGWLVGRIAL